MATYSGKEGLVKVSSATVAEVKSFTFDTEIELMEDSELSDDYATYHVVSSAASGKKSGSGSFECHYDDTDTTGQDLLDLGAQVTLNLYALSATSGREYITGSAIIKSWSVAVDEGIVKRTFNFVWNGTFTIGDAV